MRVLVGGLDEIPILQITHRLLQVGPCVHHDQAMPREQLVLTITLATTVPVAIKIVGVLLIAAMLIIPAAAARPLSRTPEGMAIAAGLIGVLSAIIGLRMAYVFDTPAGPFIVCVAAITFLATSILRGFRHTR